jgi:hypothetical protein
MNEYTAADIVPLTMREAIEKRPAMYFGDRPRSDWPLVMMGMTVLKLARHVPSPARTVQVTVHAAGDFTVSVGGASTSWNPQRVESAKAAFSNDLWWRHVALATSVTVSDPPGGSTTDQNGRLHLDDVAISVRMACDPDVAQSDASVWWEDWISRLPRAIDDLVRRPEEECSVVMIDERTPLAEA